MGGGKKRRFWLLKCVREEFVWMEGRVVAKKLLVFVYEQYNANVCAVLWPVWQLPPSFYSRGHNGSHFIVSSRPSYRDLCSPSGNCFVMLTLSHWTTPLALFFFFFYQYCTNSRLTWGQTSAFCKSFSFFLSLICFENGCAFKKNKTSPCCYVISMRAPPPPTPPSVVWSLCSAPHCLNTSSVPRSLIHAIMIPDSLLVLKWEALPPQSKGLLLQRVCVRARACVRACLCLCVDSGL